MVPAQITWATTAPVLRYMAACAHFSVLVFSCNARREMPRRRTQSMGGNCNDMGCPLSTSCAPLLSMPMKARISKANSSAKYVTARTRTQLIEGSKEELSMGLCMMQIPCTTMAETPYRVMDARVRVVRRDLATSAAWFLGPPEIRATTKSKPNLRKNVPVPRYMQICTQRCGSPRGSSNCIARTLALIRRMQNIGSVFRETVATTRASSHIMALRLYPTSRVEATVAIRVVRAATTAR
mmetsp:Transcript_4492/g.10443  ORF Transcript_4492/g.10443 Transcript_4492/m.10443 type:complete len:239 (-) Transcript_4492:261-977(-)